jgi:hypothetical protein
MLAEGSLEGRVALVSGDVLTIDGGAWLEQGMFR